MKYSIITIFLFFSFIETKADWYIIDSFQSSSFYDLKGYNNNLVLRSGEKQYIKNMNDFEIRTDIQLSTDYGKTWTTIWGDTLVSHLHTDLFKIWEMGFLDETSILAAGVNKDSAILMVSYDLGKNWQYFKLDSNIMGRVGCFDIDNDNIFYAYAGADLYLSDDKCKSWYRITNPKKVVPDPGKVGFEGGCRFGDTLIIAGLDYNWTYDGRLFITQDLGKNWKMVKSQDLKTNDTMENVLYRPLFLDGKTGFWGGKYVNNITNQKFPVIYKTTDGGDTWRRVLLNDDVNFIANITAFDKNNILAVGTRYIYESNDGGETWKTSELNDSSPKEKGAYFWKGVWLKPESYIIVDESKLTYMVESILTDVNDNEKNEDFKIYPNPADKNNILRIELPTQYDGNLLLKITDLKGKEVYSENYTTSSNTIEINTAKLDNLIPGAYIITIYSSDRMISEKMIYRD